MLGLTRLSAWQPREEVLSEKILHVSTYMEECWLSKEELAHLPLWVQKSLQGQILSGGYPSGIAFPDVL